MLGGGVSGLLLASAAGYWVLERAEGHKRGLRRVGRWLGGVIIVVTLVGAACRIYCIAKWSCAWGKDCPMTGRMMAPRMPAPPSQSLP